MIPRDQLQIRDNVQRCHGSLAIGGFHDIKADLVKHIGRARQKSLDNYPAVLGRQLSFTNQVAHPIRLRSSMSREPMMGVIKLLKS
ncbi:hypothetical protein SB748_25085 [Rhizobium sp. SIMBA_035]